MSDEQVEGRRAVLEALRSGREVREVLIATGVRGAIIDDIRGEAGRRSVPVRDVPRDAVESRARTPVPQGVIAVVAAFPYAELEDIWRRAEEAGEPLLCVALDGITDPHNTGALARSAEAAGAHGMIIPRHRAAGITPSAEKASAGALEWLPVALVGNLVRTLADFQSRGAWVVALDAGEGSSIHELELGTEPLCLVVGSEGRGVSRLVAERADVRCSIPMRGRVESLNASVAGGVALFEIVRRRSLGGSA